MKIAHVYWRDSKMYITQCFDENFEVSHLESSGFLLKRTKYEVVLAGDLVEGEYRRVIVIPIENIANMYVNGKHIIKSKL